MDRPLKNDPVGLLERPHQEAARLLLEFQWTDDELARLPVKEAEFRRLIACLREAIVEEGFVLVE